MKTKPAVPEFELVLDCVPRVVGCHVYGFIPHNDVERLSTSMSFHVLKVRSDSTALGKLNPQKMSIHVSFYRGQPQTHIQGDYAAYTLVNPANAKSAEKDIVIYLNIPLEMYPIIAASDTLALLFGSFYDDAGKSLPEASLKDLTTRKVALRFKNAGFSGVHKVLQKPVKRK